MWSGGADVSSERRDRGHEDRVRVIADRLMADVLARSLTNQHLVDRAAESSVRRARAAVQAVDRAMAKPQGRP